MRAPDSKTSRARRRSDCEVVGRGVRAFSLRRVILALLRRVEASG